MAALSNLSNVWNNVKEVDLRPLRQEAMQLVKIAIVGEPGSGRATLATQMRRDPLRADIEIQAPLLIADLDSGPQVSNADLIILLLDANAAGFERQKILARSWADAGKKVLVFVNHYTPGSSSAALASWVDWGKRRVIYGSADDTAFLLDEFAPAVIDLLPEVLISLGRHYPLFRSHIARNMISDTCFSNAAYALSTGLAQIVPVLDIPLNVADMVVLSKSQAFLVYKLGLALGLSTRWQDYVTEFSSVLGGGFLWRQLARSLVGLIPAWGILPKVAVAYSGTYVVGNVVLQWYLTGRHLSPKQMRELYVQAFARGKNLGRDLLSKVPRPRLGRRKPKQLPAPSAAQVCPNCGQTSAPDALFCQYCAQPFVPALSPDAPTAGESTDPLEPLNE